MLHIFSGYFSSIAQDGVFYVIITSHQEFCPSNADRMSTVYLEFVLENNHMFFLD